MPDSSGAVDLGSPPPEVQEALDREQGIPEDEEKTGEPSKVMFAFGVVVGMDGNPSVVLYPENGDLEQQTEVTHDLVFAACSTLLKDLQAQETAQAAAMAFQQLMAQQMHAAQEAQQRAQIEAMLRQKDGHNRG